jgi:glyoxylase I family protein
MPLTERTAVVRELVPSMFVQDIARSLVFYRDRLGFAVARTWESEGKLAWCRLQRDSSAVMLQQSTEEDGPAEGRGRGIGFFFICDDVSAIYTDLSGRGLRVDPPQIAFYGMKQLFVKDPDGYELCFESPTEGA